MGSQIGVGFGLASRSALRRGRWLGGTLLLTLATAPGAWAQTKAAEPASAAVPAAAAKGETPKPAATKAPAKGEVNKPAAAKVSDKGGAMPDAFANLPVTPAAKAAGPASFDELLKDAVPVKDLATLIEPLYAKCDDSDALGRRQCEGTRDYLLDYLKTHTFVADADVQPDTTPYDATAKQVDMEVPGCVACKYPPTVAGEPRFVTTRPPQRVVEGRAQVLPVASHEISLPDRTNADRFVERVVPRLRVQQVFRFGQPYGDVVAAPIASGKGVSVAASKATPAPALATVAAAKGVLVVPLGHRVYDRCTGQVAAASPEIASPVRVTPDRSCPPKGSEELSQAELKRAQDFAALPERLLPQQIDQVLAPVQAKIHECYVEFGEPNGTAKVALTIGNAGKLTAVTLASPFDKADIGVCMRSQLKSTTFPKFRGSAMNVDYVYQVN